MTDYKDMTITQFADAARASNPELGAIDNTLVDYYSGKQCALFDNFEGDGAEETALFLASSRVMVLELVRRLSVMRGHFEAIRDYAANPESKSVNAGYMTESERISGMWSHAVAALDEIKSHAE